jgi:hypothetical protein
VITVSDHVITVSDHVITVSDHVITAAVSDHVIAVSDHAPAPQAFPASDSCFGLRRLARPAERLGLGLRRLADSDVNPKQRLNVPTFN